MSELTKKCLESLEFGRPDEVIVVDDGSPYKIKFRGPDKYIFKSKNDGYPKCVNTGLAAATGDIIIVSNNDLLYQPGWLQGLLKPLEEGYDISSICTTDSDGWVTDDRYEEDAKFGSLWAMKRTVYETLGGFDERYGRVYFEDTDYRRQALNAGFKVVKNHGALVDHIGRATWDILDPEHELFEKNKQVYIDKWGKLE